MATSYGEIYLLNKIIKNDPRLSNLTPCDLNSLRFGYLKFSISYFMYDCLKDLSDRSDPVSSEYLFDCDGVENEFLLSPAPATDSQFYITLSVGGNVSVLSDFLFDTETNTIKLHSIPSSGSSLSIIAYTVGYFNQDLNDREKDILAEGMNVPYMEESRADHNAMQYIVTGKSLRFFSQANHINASVANVESEKYNTLDALISEYSYKGSPEKYGGLASRGSGS